MENRNIKDGLMSRLGCHDITVMRKLSDSELTEGLLAYGRAVDKKPNQPLFIVSKEDYEELKSAGLI